MVEFNTVLSFIQAFGIIVGVAYYIMNIKNNQRNQRLTLETRHAQLYMTMFDVIYDQEIWRHLNEIRQYTYTDYNDFMEKYGPIKNPEAYSKLTKVWWFFTEMGTLVYRGLITVDDCINLISITPIEIWSQFNVAIQGLREHYFPAAGAYVSFEYLAKVMMSRVEAGEISRMSKEWLDATPEVVIPSVSELRLMLRSD